MIEERTKDLVDRCGKVRSFNLRQYLSDCELPDSVQTREIGDDAYISAKDADVAAALGVGPTLTSKDRSLMKADLWEVHEDSTFGGRSGTEYRRVHV